jgi:hypothetical protein
MGHCKISNAASMALFVTTISSVHGGQDDSILSTIQAK